MKIVIPDFLPIPKKDKDKIKELGGIIYDDNPETNGQLIERIKEAEIITANYVDISSEIIDAAPKLKYVIVPAVGYDWVDHEYAAKRGIKVINCPTFVSNAVAEHAIALMFALARKIVESHNDVRNGLWNPRKYTGIELSGKTLGLIGYGNIGKNIEKLALGTGMKTSHTNSKSSDDDIDELIKHSDIVCLCLPLNKNTRGMIDAQRLELFKKTAILINVARGAIIDQKALIKTLEKNKITGAGLDVFENEPAPEEKPTSDILKLANLQNVVVTPHDAYNTVGALEKLGEEIYENIKACADNKPINIVN